MLCALFIKDSENAGLWETNRQLLHNVIASLHYLRTWKRFNFQKSI